MWKSNVGCELCCILIMCSFRSDFTLNGMKWEGQGEMGSDFCMEGIMMILVNGVVNATESTFFDEEERMNHFQRIEPTLITQRSLRGGECFHYGILQST